MLKALEKNSQINIHIVGSTNKVKIQAVKLAVRGSGGRHQVVAFAAPSGVAAQPWGDEETRRGAERRAYLSYQHGLTLFSKKTTQKSPKNATTSLFGWGLEGGVFDNGDELWSTVWVSCFDGAKYYTVNGARFPVPEVVAKIMRSGLEMGHAMDKIMQTTNIREANGMIGVLTGGLVTRAQEYGNLARLALGLWRGRDWNQETSEIDKE